MTPELKYTTSLYDYTDKSVPQTGYAAIVYGVISLATGFLGLIQYFLYHSLGRVGLLHHDYAQQQWLQHTPTNTATVVISGIIIAAISGILAFGTFRRSRAAIVAMLALVIVLQLYTWIVVHSVAGTLVSIVVAGFLLRGARRTCYY